MTGIIISCMPILPSFFRHVFRKRGDSTVASSRSRSSGWKTGSSTLVDRYRNSKPSKKNLKDPYLLTTTEYEELDDLEGGHHPRHDAPPGMIKLEGEGTTTTTIERVRCDTLLPEQLAETLCQRPDTSAFVSRSVQVESHPREVVERDVVAPQQAHMRR